MCNIRALWRGNVNFFIIIESRRDHEFEVQYQDQRTPIPTPTRLLWP